jgi:aromatic-L-amino-acid decarboxylase
MTPEEFRSHAHHLVDWMADYLENVEGFPAKAQVAPGEVLAKLPACPPARGERFEAIFSDFRSAIMPGMTHWQHPLFCAYFPANSSPPSVLAEMLMATLGAQCMLWETSPAATELEQRCMEWLRGMIGLPDGFEGVIQDTASTSTLAALLSARERATGYGANLTGLGGEAPFTVYTSTEGHSSIDKAVRIAGFGSDHLRRVATDANLAMRPDALDEAIRADLAAGLRPLAVVATFGTTSSTAVDPLSAVAEVARRHGLWLHVDAAYAGSALILPEVRPLAAGLEQADSLVFNPHKWLFTNFDCSAYFVRDREALIRTFEILPEYLKTRHQAVVNNYRDWGVPLGRRFRALKLWFVIRSYGVEGLQAMVRSHIEWAREFRSWVEAEPAFEVMAPSPFGLVCFRHVRAGLDDEALNRLNADILDRVNRTGDLYITHTKLSGRYALRMVISQTTVTLDHVRKAWEIIRTVAGSVEA